jgi:hypothetical protein
MTSASVSVVIPTMLRSELPRAIASVRAQATSAALEIVVVVDDEPGSHSIRGVDRVLYTGGAKKAAAARNLGVRASTGDYVAFLDDDDIWFPDKTEAQLRLFSDNPHLQVASSRVRQFASIEQLSSPLPGRLISGAERVEEYLFRRRPVSARRPSLFTSTLMAKREAALSVRWRPDLPRHQDWDWLCAVQDVFGVGVFRHHPRPLVGIQVGSGNSISASSDWASSLSWAKGQAARWDPAVRADFLAAQTLRYAHQARSLPGTMSVWREIASTRRVPSPSTLVLGFSGVLGRRAINRALTQSM